jgi:hypothetical protein
MINENALLCQGGVAFWVMYQILCQRRRRGYHLEWVKVKKKEVPRDTTFGNTEFATSI